MRKGPRAYWCVSTLVAAGLVSPLALAQESGGAPAGGDGSGQVQVAPSQTNVTTYSTPPPGFPQPGAGDPNEHLPSSSRPTTDPTKGDGFDLSRGSGAGGSIRGTKGSSAVLGRGGAMRVPSFHTVRRGDTLWGLSGYYYGNSWNWPKVWSYNPQVTNPHWIYPGDQVRMKQGGAGDFRDGGTLGDGGGLVDRRAAVPRNTVFLRSTGYIDDPKRQVWGELLGSREDQMLLADGNHVYLKIRKGVNVVPGQKLTIFTAIRKPAAVKGARRPPGQIIAIKGTVRIDHFDDKKRLARGEIVESTDVIERGALIGDVGRRIDVVPPKPSRVNRWARVLTSVYPHELMGQNQVVFIDRGTEDGLSSGNRLFIVAKGDAWRASLKTATRSARDRLRIEVPESASVETTPLKGNEKDFPEEIVGEVRVLRANKYSSVCLVTVSHREIEPGDRAVARKGF
ncbi:MAG: LysM peptidoglycan-binding domain-containing protein [Myxococcales bacterium]|nr:LysM peptidoglycan-binding domain-containing protein [Myxococcales bacterium]